MYSPYKLVENERNKKKIYRQPYSSTVVRWMCDRVYADFADVIVMIMEMMMCVP